MYLQTRANWRVTNTFGTNQVKCNCGFIVSTKTALRHHDCYQIYNRCTRKRVFDPVRRTRKKKKKTSDDEKEDSEGGDNVVTIVNP